MSKYKLDADDDDGLVSKHSNKKDADKDDREEDDDDDDEDDDEEFDASKYDLIGDINEEDANKKSNLSK